MGKLIEYYGTECVHCKEMEPHIKKLEKETGLKITKKEVWHDEKNAREFHESDKGRCGGVPFFYNENTTEYLCGSTDYKTFKAWATKGTKPKKKPALKTKK
ncbi:hypothetical protein COT72_01585 [archaeon CG10_big_fil_rev_8_21_14_0_10_43_11]|nr:MAG: hypothetical protein COT72_01585 [archaeon CG10_big_fil_rev_8_21_14_0_10_43_11]